MTLIDSCSIPAVSPVSGGDGELAKTDWLEEHIKGFGFDRVERYDVEDDMGVMRPNLIAVRNGAKENAPTLWFVSHTDVVPEGDLALWDTDPWKPVIIDDKVVGRGVEDNGTPMVASLYAVRALEEAGVRTGCHVGCAMLADEENGSKWGIQHVLAQDVFQPDDIIMVGSYWAAPFLAVWRNAFRMTYGFGFIYDRNYSVSDFEIPIFFPSKGPR